MSNVKNISSNEVRKTFLDYFAGKGHVVVPSAPLVPLNDPTLMFINCGMAPFKNVFTGAEVRDYVRATSSQKSVRAGGKHNDLENVGYTARHHTFFEMLGNFSFGDYFKEEAISYAWELITKVYGLPEDRLVVTVYHTDDEAYDLWKKIAGLPDDRIIRIKTSDNFWSMGDTGPCGPCSEIFYDHGEHIEGGLPGTPEEDGDRFVEIWNLVFMQYDQQADGSRIDLPKPCIDTGMGLERITAVLNGTHDNYQTPDMRALIEASANVSNSDSNGEFAVSHRVIADHLRCCSFLIADGVLPSNEGRGYVLRRIMRRAMRHAHIIGAKDPMMHLLVPQLVTQMGGQYGELKRAEALIKETLQMEEVKFKTLLGRGLKLLDAELADLAEDKPLSGEVAFKLYDTYGFPLDLTEDVLRSKGGTVDTDGFDVAMEKQRTAARAAWSGSGDAATDKLWFELEDRLGVTEFLGYNQTSAEAEILAIIKDGIEVEQAQSGDIVQFITNQTPFYGESGGQVGDKGSVFSANGLDAVVTDTQKKLGGLFVHDAKIIRGEMAVNMAIEMSVNNSERAQTSANHSATHLLHAALREKLGKHVSQKGSLVSPNRLRFDISHPKGISADELQSAEDIVNDYIRSNGVVETRLMPIDEAMEVGAMALFGEKYGDEVRVVTMGDVAEGKKYSVELCGGIHVKRTGDIGLLKIVSESAVSSGVRRIEALTGKGALAYLDKQDELLQVSAAALKISPADLPERLKNMVAERRSMEKEISDLKRKLATSGSSGEDAVAAKDIGGIKFDGRIMEGLPAKELKPLTDELKAKIGSGVVTLVAVNDGKASIVVGVTDDLTSDINAVDLVRLGAAALGGKGGGGRADMAQAGGPDGAEAKAALAEIEANLAG